MNRLKIGFQNFLFHAIHEALSHFHVEMADSVTSGKPEVLMTHKLHKAAVSPISDFGTHPFLKPVCQVSNGPN